jgi:LmbE family N-acetylglucosaminyl deacetylase
MAMNKFLFFSLLAVVGGGYAEAKNKPLQIIMIGAHPDDCDIKSGGTAALFAEMGHHVKFVSVTNGDAGHMEQGGGVLAKRRTAEAKEAGKRLGIQYDVLDNHDGELLPTLENRLKLIRIIREWNADIVISHRTNDYHPDHRYTGILVQDAAFLVAVPNIAADTPPLKKNPVFLYFEDKFQKPNPFVPAISVDITRVIDKKVDALDAHESQFYQWLPWINGNEKAVPSGRKERKAWILESRWPSMKPEVRENLKKWYGELQSNEAKYAESFEICEYGYQPDEGEIKQLFPMLGKK